MSQNLKYIIHHVFLPHKLPQKDDRDLAKDIALVNSLVTALTAFKAYFPPHEHCEWLSCIKMLEAMLEIRDPLGSLNAATLKQKLQDMSDRDILALYIRGQNAGVVVRRSSDQISFESFEVAPTNEAVTQTRGRLIRSFPGPAVAIKRNLILDPDFCQPLADFLVSLDGETPEEVQPTITKSGSKTIETRDTVHPRFVTEMLTGFLRALGDPIEVPRITKCTREDVLWDDAYMPWQRSPLWLLLRVALQTSLASQNATDRAHVSYKSFMVFFMSRILDDALQASFPGDLLFAMTAKIGRRTLKLGLAEQIPWLQDIEMIINKVQKRLTKTWDSLQQKQDPFATQGKWNSSSLDYTRDSELTLSTMLPYLKTINERSLSKSSQKTFTPHCADRISSYSERLPDTDFAQSTGKKLRLCLADLELWVYSSLQTWLSTNIDSKHSCAVLKELMYDYTKAASQVYLNVPEEMSIMLLTTMELWVALDKCALRDEPILQDYDPGFPAFLFEPLLLPKRHQMERLLFVEQYLAERKRKAKPFPSVFRSVDSADSLPVRYFNQSPMHQNLRQKIEAKAANDRSTKKRELARLKKEHSGLLDECRGLECTYYYGWGKRQKFQYHSSDCRKCKLETQAKSMKIEVHEWPLPEHDLKARAAVFELDVPPTIAKWRDATYAVLTDVLCTLPESSTSRNGNSKKLYLLHDYDGLRNYIGSPAGRIQLASIAKSFLVAHYRHQPVSQANEKSICKNHNLQYKAYDSKRGEMPPELTNYAYVRKTCTQKLPSGPLQILQSTLDNTLHTSNEVIAGQSKHPISVTLHESYAFATLRSGHRLQWRNIARELVAGVINFNRNETYLMITQAAWQAGPLGEIVDPLRESHVDLGEEGFGLSLLSELTESFGTIEANWQGASAARTFTALVARVLSLSPHKSVQEGCIQLLRKARAIALHWMRELNQKVQEASNEEETKTLRNKALEMALTCHESFDVDLEHLQALLLADEDVASMTECSIAAHDYCPAVTEGLPVILKALLRRHWRRSYHCEPHLRNRINRGGNGLDSTVQRLWAGYRPGVSWTALEMPNERWLMTSTTNDASESAPVHYNLLDGTLLVNGSPLTRLPQPYEADPSYRRVFGDRVLDVIPSTASGMGFETREKIHGHQVYFGMPNSKLIIRAKNKDRTYELIPTNALGNDFPYAFINEYVHWLDLDTKIIEWRLVAEAWSPSGLNWQMRLSSNGSYKLARDALVLLDPHKATAKALTLVFSPLEQATYIHIMLNDRTGLLEIHLPRLKLDFFSKKGTLQLESKQYRGMFVDGNQSLDTFTGLVNKLVLRGKIDSSRIVIIPYGEVAYDRDSAHVRVDVKSADQPSYHVYSIDRTLGRIIDNGSLTSKLFMCYLHAVTSNYLPDRLTSKTGTEEAISILRSASAQSFLRLEEEDINLLEHISKITPVREFYPPGHQVMHTVHWTALPPLSQHHVFDGLARSIICQANTFKLFEGYPARIEEFATRGKQSLLERAAIRHSTFYIYHFGAEDHSTKYDEMYAARDTISESNRELEVYRTAKLVNRWSQDLRRTRDLLSEMISWNSPVHGVNNEKPLVLGFGLQWLVPPEQFLPTSWCTLQTVLSESARRDKYRIMVFLSTLSYSKYRDVELVETLLAFATISELRSSKPPQCATFDLSRGFKPQRGKLLDLTHERTRSYSCSCPEYDLPRQPNESSYEHDDRRRGEHRATRDEHVESFVDDIISQWPARTLRAPVRSAWNTYIDVSEALKDAKNQFNLWHQNVEFQKYVNSAQNILNSLAASHRYAQSYSFSPGRHQPSLAQRKVDLQDLLQDSAPKISPFTVESFDAWMGDGGESVEDHGSLKSLLASLSTSSSAGFEQRYIEDLDKSSKSFYDSTVQTSQRPLQGIDQYLREYLGRCETHLRNTHQAIIDNLQATTSITLRIAFQAQMFPRLSRLSLLQCLATMQQLSLNKSWKACLIEYGLSISNLQRAYRLVAAIGNTSELLSELQNPGRQGWDPMMYPDWLLLEIENNLCIRPVQAQIAQAMISPRSGANSVMQLNMGEGKSSVIVPIVATALADTKKLVRVIVLKPLATQMFQSLVRKLGGLLNRRIFYMPFSRAIRLDIPQAMQIRQLYEECMSVGGVLLAQPEHLLSFELMGPERLLSSASEVGKTMFETQRWLDTHSRDILDESDEILSVRFELTYTMGRQAMVEFGPDRWTVIEYVLGLVRHFAPTIAKKYPDGLEIHSQYPGCFPKIRVLQASVGEELTTMIAEHIHDQGMPGLPVWNRSKQAGKLLLRYLTDIDMTEAEAMPLQVANFGVESIKKTLLLLRGLIAGRVLAFAFEQKRYRVNYGLDLSRTMLSVPYRAKDIPAARAEFSHPDTTIFLTCLSYYYCGLSSQQLYSAFEILLLSDQAQDEYDQWTQDAWNIPNNFRQLAGINLSDHAQCEDKVFPHLRFAKAVIDFYMSRIVFSREMQEFPEKISSSGWDIAKTKNHPTTGFSGTNDSRYVLPLSVDQCDLPEQLHTNAAVLNCLLRAENTFQQSTPELGKESLDEKSLIDFVIESDPPVRVILDVGAQIIELTNEEVARRWLRRIDLSKAEAAIFFDSRNELSVMSRNGMTESFLVSPFAKQMDRCLVYLDESHTRGTDLKLPTDYRAAVTLGPNLTKDRLVQACMRMRKLGKGQSVMFCAPKEVERKIRECVGKGVNGVIEVADVLRWSIQETCISTRRCVPLWAIQGVRHQRRQLAWPTSLGTVDSSTAVNAAKQLLEPEAKSLEERYGFARTGIEEQIVLHDHNDELHLNRKDQLDAIRNKCDEFGISSFSSAKLQEEQERELSPENEKERQVERPPQAKALVHKVHHDVRAFVKNGILDRTSAAFQPAFQVLERTSARKHLEKEAWPSHLLVTHDFARTIETSKEHHLDDYLRPVHWIATCRHIGTARGIADAVILSPFEANELLPSIRLKKAVTLHVYSPRANRSVRSLEGLSFCAVPPVPKSWPVQPFVIELNLFAGQLYLSSHDEYLSLCQFLGLSSRRPRNGVHPEADGFIKHGERGIQDPIMARECRFRQSPVEFLRISMALRRKGQEFKKSHMGGLLHGELLAEDRFE